MATIVALSFYAAAYPPQSGGEQRLYYIYYYLSKFFDIKLISFVSHNPDNKIDVIDHGEKFKEIRIPRSKLSDVLQILLTRFTNIKEWSAILVSLDSKFNEKFSNIVRESLIEADVVIFVSPFLFTLPKNILKGKKIIYESYNLEYDLMKSFYLKSVIGKPLLTYVYNIEKKLSEVSNLIFAVSSEDKVKLSNTYDIDINKIYLIPNGVNLENYNILNSKKYIIGKNPLCLFIGSYHPPNFEAVECIIKMASKLSNAYFLIAGSVALYYINNFYDSLDHFDVLSTPLFNNQAVYLQDGFYSLEHWNSTPIRWCQPSFEISISEDVESIVLIIFSPYDEDLAVNFKDKSMLYKIYKGSNSIRIINEINPKRSLISFKCEMNFSDPGRLLGVAIQSISYYVKGKKLDLDLSQTFWRGFTFKNARNILLLGKISDEEKNELYRISDISLNPMTSGSGTNIKLLDYMAAGLPVITTSLGARGLGIENYRQAIICPISDFPEKILDVLRNKDLYASLKENGRKFIEENYNWENIAEIMGKIISDMMAKVS